MKKEIVFSSKRVVKRTCKLPKITGIEWSFGKMEQKLNLQMAQIMQVLIRFL
jgi:hypothetical protein